MRLLISKVGERIELNHHTLHEDTYVYVSILTSRCVVNEDGGDSEVLELRNYEASRNYSTEREKERERERERGRERVGEDSDARWWMFARSFGKSSFTDRGFRWSKARVGRESAGRREESVAGARQRGGDVVGGERQKSRGEKLQTSE